MELSDLIVEPLALSVLFYYVQLRIHKDGYVLGSEYISDLVEGEHKEEHRGDAHHTVGDLKAEGHGHGRTPLVLCTWCGRVSLLQKFYYMFVQVCSFPI